MELQCTESVQRQRMQIEVNLELESGANSATLDFLDYNKPTPIPRSRSLDPANCKTKSDYLMKLTLFTSGLLVQI